MPREGAIIFRDIAGKLDVLRVECDKYGRRGSYPLDRLIERHGIDAKLFDWEPEADCPRKQAKNLKREVPGSVEGAVTRSPQNHSGRPAKSATNAAGSSTAPGLAKAAESTTRSRLSSRRD